MSQPPRSLWWDELPPELTAPLGEPLDGDVTSDVAIVGAGYTGLWTAYYLQLRDPSLRIRIVDANVAGFGASGRNGGWCSALFPASLRQLAERSSRADAIRMKRTMYDTVDEVGRVAADEGWDIRWAKGGTLGAARSDVQAERARAEIQDMRDWGFGEQDARLLDQDEALARARIANTQCATYTPHCAAIDPARLVRELARTVVARGAVLHEHTAATSLEPGIVRTALGNIRAQITVRATEGFTGSLQGRMRELAPVYSLMLATEPLPDDVWSKIGLAERETFHDQRHLIIYGQRTADGRFAFGGRGAPYHFNSKITPAQDQNAAVHSALRATLVELFPIVRDAKITHTWGGPLGVPRDWWASCGFDPRTGAAYSGGYVGDGVGTSNLGGRTLADLITNHDTELTTLPWVNHHSPKWEPEPLRWFATNAGLRVMTFADASEARTGKPSKLAAMFARKLGH